TARQMTKCERKLRRDIGGNPFSQNASRVLSTSGLTPRKQSCTKLAQLSVSQLSAPTIISAFRAADRSNLKHLTKRAERQAGKLRQNIKKQGGHIALPSAPDFTCAR